MRIILVYAIIVNTKHLKGIKKFAESQAFANYPCHIDSWEILTASWWYLFLGDIYEWTVQVFGKVIGGKESTVKLFSWVEADWML